MFLLHVFQIVPIGCKSDVITKLCYLHSNDIPGKFVLIVIKIETFYVLELDTYNSLLYVMCGIETFSSQEAYRLLDFYLKQHI